MEVSVRGLRRGPGRSPAVAIPRLRVWPTECLLLHEEADPARVRRLADALRRDGVLRNPPIVAPLPPSDAGRTAPSGAERAVVLDGANRVTALRTLGLAHAVVQSVSYDDPRVSLSVWRHYAAEGTPGTLRAAAADLGAVTPIEDETEAEARIAAGEGIAAVIDARGGVLLREAGFNFIVAGGGSAGGAAAAAADALRGLAALYRDGRAVHRVDAGTLDDLRIAYGAGALVLFRRFEKSEILDLAVEGGRLPAGITRHVIPGRALRLNTPLAWLADAIDTAAKQTALDAQLRQRWQAHGVRYYAEPTFFFDE